MPSRPALVQASAEKLALLARLREQEAAADAAEMAGIDVFRVLGYEPNCLPRHEVRKRAAARMGITSPFDARVAVAIGDSLPPPCGQCPQELFHAATEDDVMFGGAAGAGKSVGLVAEGLKWIARYPKLRVLLIRRSYDELEESIFPALRKFSYGEALGMRWNGVKRELRSPNGALFRFRYLETVDDASRRQGGEYQLLLVDEYGLCAPGVVDFLRYERLRSDGTLPVIGVRCTSNPGGPAHGEAKARYIEPTDYGKKVYTDGNGMTVRFIPGRATHNPHLDPGYLKRLDAIPDPNRRAAMRDGDWDTFSGAIFPELSQDRHVLEPMPLPAGWRRYCGVDWGFTKPWAVLWAAVDEDDRVWVYRELYATQVGEKDQAAQILAAEPPGEDVLARFADDAMWAVRGDAKPIAEVYAENGVWLTPAGKGPGSRVQGWQRIHSFLAEMPACPHHRALGWETCPRLHMSTVCKNLYSELKNLPYATTGNTEDADPKASDHACLVAGTLVETARGAVPIERVAAGDLVRTRAGMRRVLAAGMTARNAAVGTVRLSNGATLTGTANHPVWMQGQGWKRLDALRYSDIISICPAVNPSSSTASPSGVTQTRKTGPTGCTSLPAWPPGNRASSGFTRKSGRQSTGRSLRITMSTTRTTIPSTTIRPTWSASPPPSTTLTMPLTATTVRPSGSPTWRRFGRWLRSGTGRTRAVHGTANTAGEHGKAARPSLGGVSTAAVITKFSKASRRGSARPTASTAPGSSRVSMTRRAPANCVAWSSGSTSTCASDSAPVHVLHGFRADSERRDVYNLTVEGTHEFYANGVLVHNCDALRYLLLNIGGGAEWFTTQAPAAIGLPGAPRTLAPLGPWAVREDKTAVVRRRDLDAPVQGAVQLSPFA